MHEALGGGRVGLPNIKGVILIAIYRLQSRAKGREEAARQSSNNSHDKQKCEFSSHKFSLVSKRLSVKFGVK